MGKPHLTAIRQIFDEAVAPPVLHAGARGNPRFPFNRLVFRPERTGAFEGLAQRHAIFQAIGRLGQRVHRRVEIGNPVCPVIEDDTGVDEIAHRFQMLNDAPRAACPCLRGCGHRTPHGAATRQRGFTPGSTRIAKRGAGHDQSPVRREDAEGFGESLDRRPQPQMITAQAGITRIAIIDRAQFPGCLVGHDGGRKSPFMSTVFVAHTVDRLKMPCDIGQTAVLTAPGDADPVSGIPHRMRKQRNLVLPENEAAPLLFVAVVMIDGIEMLVAGPPDKLVGIHVPQGSIGVVDRDIAQFRILDECRIGVSLQCRNRSLKRLLASA